MTDFVVDLGANADLLLRVTELSTNIPGNYSTVQGDIYLIRNAGARYSNYTNNSWALSIDGQGASGSGTYDIRTGDQLKLSTTFNVAHNSDGTRTITVAVSFSDPHGNIGSGSGSWAFALSTIPRASVPTFSPAPVDAGTVCTITTNRADGTFTHDITYALGSSSGTIGTGVGASTTWTPPLALLNEIPAALTGNIVITTVTKNSGGTVIGTTTTNMVMSVPVSVVPTFTTCTVTEGVSAINTAVGKFVQGLSKFTLAVTGAAGVYSSTIASYSATVNGQTLSGSSASLGTTPNVISASGTVPIVVTVTDSRNRTATQTINASVLAYAPPVLNAPITGQRALSTGVVDDNGTYIRSNINASVASLLNGATQKNQLTYKIWTRDHVTGGAFTLKLTVPPGGITFNSYGLVSPYAVTNSWDVLVEVSDLFSTSAVQYTITTAIIFQHWNSSLGMGIGKYRQFGMLDVLGQIYQDNGEVVASKATLIQAVAGTDDTHYSVSPAGVDARTRTGTIAANWSSGQPVVTFTTPLPDGTTSVSAFLSANDDISIIAGATVLLQKYGTAWMILTAVGMTPKFPREIRLPLSSPWVMYDSASGASADNQYGDPPFPANSVSPTWAANTAGWLSIYVTPTGVVTLSGLIVPLGTPTPGSVIATLPVGLRPLKTNLYISDSNNGADTMLITPDGAIRFVNGTANTFFSVSGLRFRADSYVTAGLATRVQVMPYVTGPFVADTTSSFYTGQTALDYTPSYTIDADGVVVFEGNLKANAAYTGSVSFAQFTALFNYTGSTHMISHQQAAPGAVGIVRYGANGVSSPGTAGSYMNANVSMVSGNYISLSQVILLDPSSTTTPSQVNALQNSWADYGAGWRTHRVAKTPGGLVIPSGLIAGAAAVNFASFPTGWRPRYREIHTTLSNAAFARLDLGMSATNGVRAAMAMNMQVGSTAWLSLDGVAWQAQM